MPLFWQTWYVGEDALLRYANLADSPNISHLGGNIGSQ